MHFRRQLEHRCLKLSNIVGRLFLSLSVFTTHRAGIGHSDRGSFAKIHQQRVRVRGNLDSLIAGWNSATRWLGQNQLSSSLFISPLKTKAMFICTHSWHWGREIRYNWLCRSGNMYVCKNRFKKKNLWI